MTFIEEVDIGSNLLNTTQAMIDLSLSFEWDFDYEAFRTILQILDMITMAYFCAEYIVRFICAPKKKTFRITGKKTKREVEKHRVARLARRLSKASHSDTSGYSGRH